MSGALINCGPSQAGSSFYGAMMRCGQLWAYQALLRLPEGRNRAALDKGSLMHVWLAHHYQRMRARQQGLEPNDWLEPDDAVRTVAGATGTSEHVALVLATGSRYVAEYALDEQDVRVIAVEHELAAQIPAPRGAQDLDGGGDSFKPVDHYLFTLRVDLQFQDRHGKVWMIDHKCLPHDATVESYDGGPREVGALAGAWRCCAWGDLGAAWAPAEAPQEAGLQDVYVVRTKSGRRLPLGWSHPVLTSGGFKAAWELRSGDQLVLAAPPDREEAPWPDEMYAVAAMLTCDGALTRKDLALTKKNHLVQSYYQGCLTRLEVGFAFAEPAARAPLTYLRGPNVGPFREKLEAFGLKFVLSPERGIPSGVWAGSNRQVGLFLGGLWCGDGAAYLRSCEGQPLQITYASRSRALCVGVQALLTRLGIYSSFVESSVSYEGERRPYYFTTIVGAYSKRRFLEMVREGIIRCPKLLDQVPALLASIRSKPGDHRYGAAPQEEGSFLDGVVSKLYRGREACVDIVVPQWHTFTVSDIVTHNTSQYMKADTLSAFALDIQFLGLAAFGQALYKEHFGGVIVNVINWPEGRYQFNRARPAWAPWALSRFLADLAERRAYLTRLAAEGQDPWRFPPVFHNLGCRHIYGFCDYFEQCKHGPEGPWQTTSRP